MRKALNDNPMVQLAVCGVLLVVVGFVFMSSMKRGGSEATSEDQEAAAAVALPAGVSSDGAAAPSGAAPAPAAVAPGAPSVPATPPAPSVSAEALEPGPGLPAPVVKAWKSGDAVVLLIAKVSATDDRLVRASVESLSSRGGISVFVARADKVARYSRITQGVGVNRVPALVVVRPRSVSKGVPQAVVSYGFRDSQSVVQAVEDALYSGGDTLPYYPG
jgi:hypothetical protein